MNDLITQARMELQQHPENTYQILEDLFDAGYADAQETVNDWLDPSEYFNEGYE